MEVIGVAIMVLIAVACAVIILRAALELDRKINFIVEALTPKDKMEPPSEVTDREYSPVQSWTTNGGFTTGQVPRRWTPAELAEFARQRNTEIQRKEAKERAERVS